MPLVEKYEHGVPCWFDLATIDLAASKEFYSGLFGWSYIDEQMGEMGIGTYSMAMVDDVPSKVGNYGISTSIADPTRGTGNVWQSIQSGPTIKHEHGSMQWCEYMTTDPAAVSAFFRTLLRVKTEPMEMGDGSVNSLVFTDEGPVMNISGLSGLGPNSARYPGPMWVTYFNVNDVDATVEIAVQHGADLPDPPWDVPGVGRMAWIYDPQGALTGLITPAPTA